MATLDGARLAGGLIDDSGTNLSVDLSPDEGDFSFGGEFVLSSLQAGNLSDTQPVTEPCAELSGERLDGWNTLYYQGVHVIPDFVDAGNLVATRQYSIEVWNATDEPQAMAAIQVLRTQGMSLDVPSAPPTTFGAMESRLYTLTVGLEGPGRIDGWWTFDFPPNDPTLHVVGWRVAVIGVRPDWSRVPIERLSWLTDVLDAYDRTEQRIRLRGEPRRTFEWFYTLTGADANRLESLLWGWQARIYAMPLWMDASWLASALPAGSTSVPVTTQYLDYIAEGLLVLWRSSSSFETVEIESVSPDSVLLKAPTTSSWAAGTRVMPARLARLPASMPLQRITDGVLRATLTYALEPGLGRGNAGAWAPQTYRGLDVLLHSPNRIGTMEDGFDRVVETIDFETGAVDAISAGDHPEIRNSHEWLLESRATICEFLGFLAARSGRWKSFWRPTWQSDLELVRQVNPADTIIAVRDIQYERFINVHGCRRDIAVHMPDHTWVFRRINAVAAGDPGEELLTLDSAVGVTIPVGARVMVCWLNHVRLDTDQIEMAWNTDSVVTTSTPMRVVPE